jgi:hypothetical protein
MNLELKLNELKNKNKVLNNEIYERYTKQTNINSVIEKPVLKKQHIQIKTENLDFDDYSLPPSYTLLEINNESLSEKFSIVKQPDTNTSGGVSNNIIITPLKTETNIVEPTETNIVEPTETNVKPTETNVKPTTINPTEIETITTEVIEDSEVFELEIDGKLYYATNEDNGIIYNINEDGDIGIEIGNLINGEPIFY